MELETTSTLRTVFQPPPPALSHGGPLCIDLSAPLTLTAGLQRTARDCPHKGIHFIQRDGSEHFLAYPALLNQALRVSAGLVAAGLKPGDKVLLQLDTLAAHYSAFWGCLFASVVPVTVAIAPTYKERNGILDKLCNTWELLQHPAIITTERLGDSVLSLPALLPMQNPRVLFVEELVQHPPLEALPSCKPGGIVFIQLSSGSTGVPKCIQETHQSIIAHIHSSKQFNGYTREDITVNWLPVDHVVPLLTFHLKDTYLGCEQIHAPPDMVLTEPLLWLDLLERYQATHTWAPNFGFKLVSDRLARAVGRKWDLSRVKFFMNAGEQVTMPVVRDFLKAVAPFGVHESAMQPAFGMAEVCTCMTYANAFSIATGARRFRKDSLDGTLRPAAETDAAVEFVSLGKVTPGISIRIADAANRLLPEGVIGRFQIQGPVVTPGYFRNDEANHDAFVGDGWFNTGDLGFILDGELFLTGREKEMIIIRGAKFYCYEVEDVVNGVLGVEPTFVAACGVNDPAIGTEALAIFFSPAEITDDFSVAQAIRKRVTARLGIAPGFVVPVPPKQFPKTTSGKIQRTQLKKRLESGAFSEVLEQFEELSERGANRPPDNDTEARLMAIWCSVLGHVVPGVGAHLFEVGGDSLKATQIVSRIRDQWKLEFPLHLLFSHAGTIEGMSSWIAGHRYGDDHKSPPAIQPLARNHSMPLSYSQLRLWLAEQIDPGTSLYNICRLLSLDGPLNVPALEWALQKIVDRHEILRTVYRLADIPAQEILPSMPLTVARHDLAPLPDVERQQAIFNLINDEVSLPFNLETGPLLRATLVQVSDERGFLILVLHQIVTDAWSLNVFFHELKQLYEAFSEAKPDPLAPLTIQYADYAMWQQRWFSDAALEQQLAYWKRKIDGPLLQLDLNREASGDRHPAAVIGGSSLSTMPDNRSSVSTLLLTTPMLRKIRAFCARHNTSLHMTLLAAFDVLLANWSGQHDIVTGSPESGRRRLETEGLLGCFVNMLLLRNAVRPDDSFARVLGEVRSNVLEAFANADVPFEKVLQAVPAGEYRTRPFQVWFGPIDSLKPFDMGSVRVEVSAVFPPEAQFDLSCFVAEQDETATCFFEHRLEVLGRGQAALLIRRFESLLMELIETPELPVNQLSTFEKDS